MADYDLPPIDPILSITTCADLLNLSKRTVERIIADQKMRVIRISDRRLGVRRSELARYIAEREAVA
jgi:excisionase family DNA binding protein